MSNTDKVIIWCIAFSICVFAMYTATLSIKYPKIFKGYNIEEIAKYISEFNEEKISVYRDKKNYLRMLFLKLVGILMSPYLFILKLLDFFAYIILWIISMWR